MGDLQRELRLALHRLAGDAEPQRQRLRAVLDPDLPIDVVPYEGEVVRGHAVDGFASDELATLHLLREDLVRLAEQEVGTGRLEIEPLAQRIDRAVYLR